MQPDLPLCSLMGSHSQNGFNRIWWISSTPDRICKYRIATLAEQACTNGKCSRNANVVERPFLPDQIKT